MIIPTELQNFYDNINTDLIRLKDKVEPILKDISNKNSGFHICDIKKPGSLSQKIEITNDANANDVIDLFRATIIVPTRKEIIQVSTELREFFIINSKIENRPKRPELFIYDDLHLFLVFKDDQILEHEEYKKRSFELQIKSFLQYGWQKATHDLIYKGHELNWSNHRIAHQIKAILEQSDELLTDIQVSAHMCPKSDYMYFDNLNQIIALIKEKFEPSVLPNDVRRMARNINELLRVTSIDLDFLIMELNNNDNKGLIQNLSLSPFQSVLAIIIKKEPQKLLNGLRRNKKRIYVSNSLRDFLKKIPKELGNFEIKLA